MTKLNEPENATVDFRLHFAHGAQLRQDSVFNVLLNDRFESAILDAEPRAIISTKEFTLTPAMDIKFCIFKPDAIQTH